MQKKDIELISDIAVNKFEFADRAPMKYFFRAIVAGFFLVVAIILSYTTGAVLNNAYPEVARIMVAATFSLALGLIAFIGGELFTGNNMIMAMGIYNNDCTLIMALKIWFISYLGNFIGSIILAFLFVKSGASIDLINDYAKNIVDIKLTLPALELFLRGVLCNFIVCIAFLSTIKMKSEAGKLIIMFWCIFAFVIAGFEHSIANMGIFSITYFSSRDVSLLLIFRNLFWVTLGNMVGGGVLLALPLKFMSIDME